MLSTDSLAPQISSAQKIVLSPQVLIQDMSGESALLNMTTEVYFSQNTIATQMLSALTQAASIESAYKTLLEEYAVEPERLQADLMSLVTQWLEAGVVELHSTEDNSI